MRDFVNNILGYLVLKGMTQKEFAAIAKRDKATVNGWLNLGRTTSLEQREEVARSLGELPFKFTSAQFGFFAEAIDRVRDADGNVDQARFPKQDRRNLNAFMERAQADGGGLNGQKLGPWLPLVRFGAGAPGDHGSGIPDPVGKVPVTLDVRDKHPRAVVVQATPGSHEVETALGSSFVVIDAGALPPRDRKVTTLLRTNQGPALALMLRHGALLLASDPQLVLDGGTAITEDLSFRIQDVELLGTRVRVMSNE